MAFWRRIRDTKSRIKEMDKVTLTAVFYIAALVLNIAFFAAFTTRAAVIDETLIKMLAIGSLFFLTVCACMVLTLYVCATIRRTPRSDDSNLKRTKRIRAYFYKLEQLFN